MTPQKMVFVIFDSPVRAIRCAEAIQYGVTQLGLTVRMGLHTGECEVTDEKVTGIAVRIGARVMNHATSGEVLVSSTVKDLVAGSGIGFRVRLFGVRALRRLRKVVSVFVHTPILSTEYTFS